LNPSGASAIAQIRLDEGIRSRIALNEEYINELAQAVSEGETLPPVVIYSNGSVYWLVDGFHRYHALKRSEQETIASDVRQGTRRDAVLYAVGANARHGLRRTNADKRRVFAYLLGEIKKNFRCGSPKSRWAILVSRVRPECSTKNCSASS
jgi:hypothetical protein